MSLNVLKAVAPLVVAALLVLGTWKGDDDNFPFGPFRMYSTKQELDGQVRSLQLWGTRRADRWEQLRIDDFGLRRADLEGQLGKLEVDPVVLLTELGISYERLHGEPMPFMGLQLRQKIFHLRGGQAVDDETRVLGTWTTRSEMAP